ncbi:HDL207Wp [Eremothecium sinecaudum]|uniref:HDL207Wp n=1 Tax=Eremothecium sinecaudum TaxID=45286 RepID=A0A109UYY7_9SACH|nr:HDL207Wp [Eremothecium sinecaudum]AMD20537.1 HDL207Wp [Eremothecium sinecaudum]
MSNQVKYPCTNMDQVDSITLTDMPLDDYQRYYFLQLMTRIGSSASPTSLLSETSKSLHIKTSSYRTNSAFLFYDISMGQSNFSSHQLSRKERRTLECFEYQIPDITKGPVVGNGLYLEGNPLVVNSKNLIEIQRKGGSSTPDISFLTKNQQFKLKKLQYSEQCNSAINPNNVILWDYKTGYVFFTGIWRIYQDVMRAMCIMKRANGDDDKEANKERQMECVKELEYSLKSCLYEPYSQQLMQKNGYSTFYDNSAGGTKRRPSVARSGSISSGAGRGTNESTSQTNYTDPVSGVAGLGVTSGSSVNYIDVHWNQLDPAWKDHMCRSFRESKKLDITPDFHDCCKRIRGGYIKIQGTWLPFEICRELCIRFCFPIRYLLAPIFGDTFPQECADWYLSHRGFYQKHTNTGGATHMLQPLSQLSCKPMPTNFKGINDRGSISEGRQHSATDIELLDASKNLLDISRRTSGSLDYCALPTSPIYYSNLPYRQKYDGSLGFISVGSGTQFHDPLISDPLAADKRRAHSWSAANDNQYNRETLPPISALISSLPNFESADASYAYDTAISQGRPVQFQPSPISAQTPSGHFVYGNQNLKPNRVFKVAPVSRRGSKEYVPPYYYNKNGQQTLFTGQHPRGPIPAEGTAGAVPRWAEVYNPNDQSYTYLEGLRIGYTPE